MGLLRDEDLIGSVAAEQPGPKLIDDLIIRGDPYAQDSPIQGSSVDLHVGNIYLPGAGRDELGGADSPKSDHVLNTGETAVVTTFETLHLPANVAAIGFPPSRVSFGGLLMTNPGHIDPGYDGVLRFTVINMAKEGYPLERGKTIVTVLFFSLEQPVHSAWRERNVNGSRLPTHAQISRLSRDFVDVENRAKQQGVKWSGIVAVVITGVVSLVALILQAVNSGHLFYREDVEDLKRKQQMVEYDLRNRVNIERALQDFDNRLKSIERSVQASSGTNRARK